MVEQIAAAQQLITPSTTPNNCTSNFDDFCNHFQSACLFQLFSFVFPFHSSSIHHHHFISDAILADKSLLGECIAEEGPGVVRERHENEGTSSNSNAELTREIVYSKSPDSACSVNEPASGSTCSSTRVMGNLLHEGPKLKGVQ